MTDTRFPVFNLNGGDPATVLQAWHDAHKALRRARKLMAMASPHPRDFQTMAPGAWAAADTEWQHHLSNIDAAYQHVEDGMLAMISQRPEITDQITY